MKIIENWRDFIAQPYKFKKYQIRKKTYCDNIFCFDIETTSYFVKDDCVYSTADVFKYCKYDAGKVEKFFEEAETGALCYIWQFCIDDDLIILCRELCEFPLFVQALEKKLRAHFVVNVHNFSFEYHFIRQYFNFDKVFFTESRKPLFAQIGCCEFRCTYRLTNLSLAKWGEQNGVVKKVGDLDYTVLRTPLSNLSDTEKNYCIYDLLVMVQGLRQYLKQYEHVHKIPYTLTGQIRIRVRELYDNDYKFKRFVGDMQPDTYDEFLVQHKTFAGGYVASNPRYTNLLLRDLLGEDIASAYPTQVFLNKFPSAPFAKVNAPVNWFDGNHHICLVEFQALESIDDLCVIPYSKRIMASDITLDDYKYKTGAVKLNNGKIRTAGRFAMYITEQDYAYICKYYKWKGKPIIHSHRVAPSDYIDKRFIMLMLELYKNKTELKGVDPEIYLQSKALLNSMSYGLMATAPCRDSYFEDENFVPHVNKCTPEQGDAQLKELRDKPYKNVVPYCWGMYVTAFQRNRLLSMAKHFSDNGNNRVAYGDTDSLKGFFTEDDLKIFEDDNKAIRARIARVCEERDIDPYLLSPKDKDGVEHTLGVWEQDGDYTQLKAMHAKCYAYRERTEDGESEVKITIAGVPKKCKTVVKEVDDLRDGLKFDIFNSRKNISEYKDGNNPLVTMPDGYKVKETCGINLRPTSYEISLTKEYKELLTLYGNKRNLACL